MEFLITIMYLHNKFDANRTFCLGGHHCHKFCSSHHKGNRTKNSDFRNPQLFAHTANTETPILRCNISLTNVSAEIAVSHCSRHEPRSATEVTQIGTLGQGHTQYVKIVDFGHFTRLFTSISTISRRPPRIIPSHTGIVCP